MTIHVVWREADDRHGLFEYAAIHSSGFGVSGKSRTPFLSAARDLLGRDIADPSEKLTGGRTATEIALSSTVGVAAGLGILERKNGKIGFYTYKEWNSDDNMQPEVDSAP